ncbi:MAG: Error-prone DNA polymerase [Alphaproteobacteria bacterium MarineAlpha3_Bin4]|nr:MAG: Error-prone DNA polymerase [Alphaproteobacteria bacterium MarineAlpha3_Bin4]
MSGYAELQVTSNFSFLRGASHPEEMVITAAALGHAAIAITDRHSVSGIVRAHTAAKQAGIRLVVGARLDPENGPALLCYPTNRAGYSRLTRLLTTGKRRVQKGECLLHMTDILDDGTGQTILVLPPAQPDAAFADALSQLRESFAGRAYLAASVLNLGNDGCRLDTLFSLATACRVPLIATNDVHAHVPERRPLQDVLTCIRESCTIYEAGFRLFANAERHLKSPQEMAHLFRDYPEAIARTVEVAEACIFSLDELRYEYPVDPMPQGRTPQDELVRLTWHGATARYPGGIPDNVGGSLKRELELIGELGFAPYFLTVYDIVRFAEGRNILCQGRGSAANSAVCYCLGITAVDPARIDLLFERFVSAERGEPPDIDVDFENGRREEVIQYVYDKYGRDRAGMTAAVITYRAKSAVREVGKVLGLSEDTIVALQSAAWRRSWDEIEDTQIRDAGLDPDEPTIRRTMNLAGEVLGFPRHLSQHAGGMVITQSLLSEVVPIANAAMEDRTIIEWDKDDLDALGILKIDILALGMLTCVHKAFDLIRVHHGRDLTFSTVPPEDAAVYDMLCRADSVGVFQVESRAQMSMLPRLLPRNFYDLVIEVAIVRPGPIQGDMVHPYLRRRNGEEAVEYPSEAFRQVLGKTLGIPLFQEQAMKIAIVAAGFSPQEADALRRALATFRRFGDIHKFHQRFIAGMLENGYNRDFSERCFKQIEGFADYGFPESHAASFALLVYVSSWLKCHYPAAFACALLNSQPMGFYAPAQIVRDARNNGVEVRPVDVNRSDWDCSLESCNDGNAALRLGLRQIKGLREVDAESLTAARDDGGYGNIANLWRRTGLSRMVLETLARGDVFGSMGLSRRQALWAVRGLDDAPLPLFDAVDAAQAQIEPTVVLPSMTLGEEVVNDYRSLKLSLKAHPLTLLRGELEADGYTSCERLLDLPHGRPAQVAGLVTTRQRPGSARGVVFVTMEDETAIANLIVWPDTFERFRSTVLSACLLGAHGHIQKKGRVIHVLAEKLFDLTPLLAYLDDHTTHNNGSTLKLASRDFK